MSFIKRMFMHNKYMNDTSRGLKRCLNCISYALQLNELPAFVFTVYNFQLYFLNFAQNRL